MKTNITENLQKAKSIVRYFIEKDIGADLNSIANFLISHKKDIQNKELFTMTTLLAIDDAKQGQPKSKNEGYLFLYELAREILNEGFTNDSIN